MLNSFVDPCVELANVAGLKSRDSVLFVGVGQRGLSDIDRFVNSVGFVRTNSELKRLVVEEARFDKVFVGSGNLLDAAQLVSRGGLLGHINQNPEEADELEELFMNTIERNFLNAHTWVTSWGNHRLCLTDARGTALSYTNGRIDMILRSI